MAGANLPSLKPPGTNEGAFGLKLEFLYALGTNVVAFGFNPYALGGSKFLNPSYPWSPLPLSFKLSFCKISPIIFLTSVLSTFNASNSLIISSITPIKLLISLKISVLSSCNFSNSCFCCRDKSELFLS